MTTTIQGALEYLAGLMTQCPCKRLESGFTGLCGWCVSSYTQTMKVCSESCHHCQGTGEVAKYPSLRRRCPCYTNGFKCLACYLPRIHVETCAKCNGLGYTAQEPRMQDLWGETFKQGLFIGIEEPNADDCWYVEIYDWKEEERMTPDRYGDALRGTLMEAVLEALSKAEGWQGQ